jgi:hypothetical protein
MSGLLGHRGLLLAAAAAAGDPYWASVSSLLHFEGADASTTFTDAKGRTWTANGNAQIDTAQFKYGTSSGLWDGAGDYIQTTTDAALTITTGDFTVEAFVRPVAGADRSVVSQRNSGANGWALEVRSTGAVWLRALIGGSYSDTRIATAAGTVAFGVWTHLALTRLGSLFTVWVNGVSAGTLTNSGTFDNNSNAPTRLGRSQSASEDDYSGHIDEFRFTKGVARYTSAFTPPTAAHPDSL